MRQSRQRSIEELAQLLDGELRAEDASSEARRLAQVATTLVEERPVALPVLEDDRRAALRERILLDLTEQPEPASVPLRDRIQQGRRRVATSAKTAMASGLASLMIGTTGVAFAAQEALPGDALYSVKRTTEAARLALAGDLVTLGTLELRFAEERLDEVTRGLGRLSSDEVSRALADMDTRSVDGAEHLIRAVERGADEQHLDELSDFIDRQVLGLLDIMDRLPLDARPQAEDSLGVLRRIRIELLQPLLNASCDCVTVAGDTACDCGNEEDEVLRYLQSLFDRDAIADAQRADDGAVAGTGESVTGRLDDATQGTSSSVEESVDDSRVLVPRLPGPLSDVGDAVDRTAKDLLETTTETTRETVGKVTDTVDDLLETGEGVIDGTTDTLKDPVEDTTGAVDDAVNNTTSTVDGLLGGD